VSRAFFLLAVLMFSFCLGERACAGAFLLQGPPTKGQVLLLLLRAACPSYPYPQFTPCADKNTCAFRAAIV